MKKNILIVAFLSLLSVCNLVLAQDITMEVAQVSHSTTDPDGAGPATGSVVLEFRLTSSVGTVLADGFSLLFVYQSAALMPTPTNTTTAVGPLASATGWTQNVDNRAGNVVSVSYGGRNFDRRMIVAFAQSTATPNMPVTTTPTGVARVTYWTLGGTFPQGGYITVENGGIVPQNSLSSDGGGTEYPYLSPTMNTPIPLGTGSLPVTFSNYNVQCTGNGVSVNWRTASESNSSHFVIQKSKDGSNWSDLGSVLAAGNSNSEKSYQYMDLEGGAAYYRVKQVDKDGRATYTEIRSTSCQGRPVNVLLFPVPAKDRINVAIRSDKNVKTELVVFDAAGRIVMKQSVTIAAGNNNFGFDVSRLAAGEYLLSSSDPAVQISKRFVVAR